MIRNRTYVGLSASCRRSSIAIVNSVGEIQFAHGGERLLERNGGPAYSDTLAKLAETYCRSEMDVVLALATNESAQNVQAVELDPRSARGRDVKRGEAIDSDCYMMPIALRAAAAVATFSRRCESE